MSQYNPYRPNLNLFTRVETTLKTFGVDYLKDAHLSANGEQYTFDFFIPALECYIDTSGEHIQKKSLVCCQRGVHFLYMKPSDKTYFIKNKLSAYFDYFRNIPDKLPPIKGLDY